MNLHEALLELKKGNIPLRGCGICDNLTDLTLNWHHSGLREAFRQWDGFSGNSTLPIEGDINAYLNSAKKWDRRTKFGRKRWELLDFLIERTKPT